MKAAARQHGFSFVEIMVAVLLLAICAVPMGDAIRNGITASSIAATKARELRCIKNTMETVLAEPYQSLYAAAAGKDQPAALPLPADASCDALPLVSIAKCELEFGNQAITWLDANLNPDDPRLESPLLCITVSAAASGGYAFTTLVAR